MNPENQNIQPQQTNPTPEATLTQQPSLSQPPYPTQQLSPIQPQQAMQPALNAATLPQPSDSSLRRAGITFTIAEIAIILISKLGALGLVILAIKIFAARGGTFKNDLEVMLSMWGLVGGALIYMTITDFIIRLIAVKKTKSNSIGKFLGLYYLAILFIFPFISSILKPLFNSGKESSTPTTLKVFITWCIIGGFINVILELLIYKQLNKQSNTLPSPPALPPNPALPTGQ